MLRMKHKPPFSCSFLTLDLLLIYVFLDLKKKNETTEATFFYLATLFLPTSFLIHLSGKTVKGRKDGGFPRLNSDVLMRMFLSSNYPVLKVPTITIAVSARCHTRFPPTGQRWSLELLVICHVEGSGNVPGPFQIVAMKLQWHDKTVAGEPAVNPWRSVSVFFFFFSIGPLLFSFFFSLSQQLSPTGTCWVFPSSLFICLVNSVIYHLRSVTELLLIAILRPPRCCFLDLIERRRRFLLSKGFGISLGSPKKPDGRITIRQIPTFIPCIFWFPY